MAAARNEGDALWFFARDESRKVSELRRGPRVLLDYSGEDKQDYVSLVDRARLVQDAATAKRLWSEPLRAWFPDGPEDPHIVLIEVEVGSADYWGAPSSLMVHAYDYVKARLTGEPPVPGDLARVEM